MVLESPMSSLLHVYKSRYFIFATVARNSRINPAILADR
jgi:hypothetical protein